MLRVDVDELLPEVIEASSRFILTRLFGVAAQTRTPPNHVLFAKERRNILHFANRRDCHGKQANDSMPTNISGSIHA
jgi:hypothetical protein